MATEEQTTSNDDQKIESSTCERCGQRLTITNRLVSKLSFKMRKIGTPVGALTFTIRNIALYPVEVILASKLWGNAVDLPTVDTWVEVTFDTPVLINEEVRMYVELSLASSNDTNNCPIARINNNNITGYDVKEDEVHTTFQSSTHYDNAVYDTAYIYTYAVITPLDAVARVSSIRHIFRPGFFRMQVALGDLGFDIDVAETAVRAELDTARDSFKERMDRTAKQLEEEASMSREESLRIARKLETLEDLGRVSEAPETPQREESYTEKYIRLYGRHPGFIEAAEPPSVPEPKTTPEEEQIIKDIGIRLWRKLREQQ